MLIDKSTSSNWTWPKIDGIEKFKGKLLHSAEWDEAYDWAGKRVAVIGIGSSGIQIVPKVAQSTFPYFPRLISSLKFRMQPLVMSTSLCVHQLGYRRLQASVNLRLRTLTWMKNTTMHPTN